MGQTFIKLRPHHLLCLQGFQGHGYSEAFTANMARLHVGARHDVPVQIVSGIDDICGPCPHHHENICAKSPDAEKNVRAIDSKVLSLLGLRDGHADTAENIFTLVNRVLHTQADVKDVCGDCAWREKCLWYASLGQDS